MLYSKNQSNRILQSNRTLQQNPFHLATSRTKNNNTHLQNYNTSRRNSLHSKSNSLIVKNQQIKQIINAKSHYKKIKNNIESMTNSIEFPKVIDSQIKKNNFIVDNNLNKPSGPNRNIKNDSQIIQSNKIKSIDLFQNVINSQMIQQNSNIKSQNLEFAGQGQRGKDEIKNLNIFQIFQPKLSSKQSLISQNFIRNLIPMSQKLQYEQNHQNFGYFKDKTIKISNKISQKSQNDQKGNTSLWLGQVYDKCSSSAFKNFISQELDYNETKSYCCQQILSNLLQQIRKRKSMKIQPNHLSRTESLAVIQQQIRRAEKKIITYQVEPMKFLNQESIKILAYLCNKYPQTNIQGANKKVGEIVEKMDIDNWANDQFDLLRLSNVKFTYKEDGDYTKQIMQFLNFLTQLPTKKHKKYPNMTNYKYFVSLMNKIFTIIYFKNSDHEISNILNTQGQLQLNIKQKSQLTKQEYQYSQKVRKYTNVQIGCKISQNTKSFSKQDIQSGIIKLQSNAISRVIDKWAEQLASKFQKAQKQILNRIYRFKSADGNRFTKFSQQIRSMLYKIVCEKQKQLQTFTTQLKQSVYDLSYKLATSQISDVSSLQFIKDRQRIIGEFAVKMSQSNSQYFIQILQKQISLLLESVQVLKKKWLQKYKFKEPVLYEELNVNLITFKIGDLFRCKMVSNQQEICRVLKILIQLNQNWENQYIKIIRIKNRLETGTRDILINFMLDDICPCQIQLAVAQKVSEKQQHFDKFNHFLYQLKRSYLGPVMEMCKIWTQFQSKSETFAKQIEKSTAKKIKSRKISQQFSALNMFQTKIYQYHYPFICSSCHIFCPGNSTICSSSLHLGKLVCGYCWKVKLQLQQQKTVSIKKLFLFGKYIRRYVNFSKFLNVIREITTTQDITRSKYQIHIPIQSRIIHMSFIMIFKLQYEQKQADQYDEYVCVQTKLNEQSKILKQICYQKVSRPSQNNSSNSTMLSIDQLSDFLNQSYYFYGWDAPTKLISLPTSLQGYCYQLIEQLLPRIRKIQQEKGPQSIKVCCVEIQKDFYYLIPIFVMDEGQLIGEIIFQRNIQYITKILNKKQQILQIQNRKIAKQWIDLDISIKLKMAYTIKEIYLNNNNIKNVNFIENMHMLKIFQASNNQIQQIPTIPVGLQQLGLNINRISVINKFIGQQNQIQNYKIKTLNLSVNFIQKIQNIEKIESLTLIVLFKCQIKKIQGIPSGVIVLGLGNNKIEKIQNLQNAKNLERLNLMENSINKIQNLQHCHKLEVLSLSRNNILMIQNLQMLSNLAVLNLSKTGLSPKSERFKKCNYYKGLKNFRKLRHLIVEGNQIQCLFQMAGFQQHMKQDLSQYTFLQMRQIILADNQISHIQNIELIMPYLSCINLQKNNLTSINNITNLSMLVQVNISHNMIQKLPEKDWEKLSKLRSINLSYNNIRMVPDLSQLQLVKYINLSFNEITKITKFPKYPLGRPDFARQINLSSNFLFAEQTPSDHFLITLQAIQHLNKQTKVNMLQNGLCPKKLGQVQQIKQKLNLENTKIPQSFTLNDFIP